MMTAWGKLGSDEKFKVADDDSETVKAEKKAEKLKVWFEESKAKDYCGPSDMSGTRGERFAKWYLRCAARTLSSRAATKAAVPSRHP